ncbi:MAG: YIP1 family protein [bacterium]
MGILNDLWGIISKPRITLKKIAEQRLLFSAFIVVIVTIILNYLLSILLQMYYMNVLVCKVKFPIETLYNYIKSTKFLGLLVLHILLYWILGYGIMHIIALLFKGRGNYKHLLTVGGYITILGLPFVTYHRFWVNEIITREVDMVLIGLLSPILSLLSVFTIDIVRDYISIILNFLLFTWIVIVASLAVQELYQLSFKYAIGVVLISLVIVALLIVALLAMIPYCRISTGLHILRTNF